MLNFEKLRRGWGEQMTKKRAKWLGVARHKTFYGKRYYLWLYGQTSYRAALSAAKKQPSKKVVGYKWRIVKYKDSAGRVRWAVYLRATEAQRKINRALHAKVKRDSRR